MNFLESGLGQDVTGDDDLLAAQTSISALEEPETEEALENQTRELNHVVQYVHDRYHDAKTKRQPDEDRWLKAYRNYRGEYSSKVQFTSTEKSQAFIKITKTKVLAAYSQITEVLFAGSKFPIGVVPSKNGKHLASKVTVKMRPDASTDGKPKGGDPISGPMSRVIPGDVLEKSGAFKSKLSQVSDSLVEGATGNPEDITFEPAKEAGRKMEDKIQDQLHEAEAGKEIRHTVFELALFGHGILKGPLGKKKEYPKWDEKGTYSPLNEFIPDVQYVSVWDFYPDPAAKSLKDCDYVVQRHRMSKTNLRALKKRPSFRSMSIDQAILKGPNYQKEYWENELGNDDLNNDLNRWEALEFWGYIDKEFAKEYDVDLPEEYDDLDEIQANVWVCNGEILRFVLNPFKPQRIPYHSAPYELNPYSFFGVGVAENMFDTQMIMNGFIRLMIDNAVLSSNVVFEVDETNLVPGQDMKIFPGKIFRRQAGAPGQAVFSHKFDNITQEAIMVFDKARQLADEATGMPSYAHGQTGVTGLSRTASGMSMLMGAAAQNIKAVVRNIDDYLLVPLGQDLFAFNMQFNFDENYLGDVEVIAKGTESLMRNEIRSQKILQFLQLTANPLDAPFTKRDYLLRELAASLDLDPELTVNDTREAKLAAKIMSQIQQTMAPPGSPQEGSLGNSPAASPLAPQGSSMQNPANTGSVQPGTPKGPGEQGFSANSNPMAGPNSQGFGPKGSN